MGILSLYTMWIALVPPPVFAGMVYALVHLCTCCTSDPTTIVPGSPAAKSPLLSPLGLVVVFACSYFCACSVSCPVLVLLLVPLSPCSVRVFLLLAPFVFGWCSSFSCVCSFFSTCMCYSGLTVRLPS